jgi:predicted ATPase/class 3 adenylate cyclase
MAMSGSDLRPPASTLASILAPAMAPVNAQPRALPEGVLTLFFSDVEGSTRLAKSHGDAAWAELLETHRALLRQAFAAHGGLEVDTQGDSFFAVFRMASDAVAAALAAQRALAAQAWPAAGAVRVRIGLHTGEAIARGDHYVGQEIHRASRICDAGHGGQIVVSQTTAELVRDGLPDGASLAPLGDYRLKDLGQPQRLFQLNSTGLSTTFPALRSLDIPTNLPTERSSFIGREADISAIRAHLADQRLITLTGVGGSGKTRLALQVGALELGNFADGVFFVDLAPVSDAALLAATVASACGLVLNVASGAGAASLEDRLVDALARRQSLVIVDNCEHMVEAVADLLDRILADCDKITLLATSREALAVEGEQVVPVSSLAVPDDGALTQEQAEANDAVRLFIDRAKAVKPGFALGPDNRAAVVEVCRRLDGIPLAIEFAAARVSLLSVQQIAERLQDRFRLLTGGRKRIQRQQTLSAALDWSHDLLADDERIVFRRLAVFAGGFALEAAEGVCSGGDVHKHAVLDLLGSLVAKSLVSTLADDRGQTRYRLLETVRMYASDKLAAAAESDVVRSVHRDWYLSWLEATPYERLMYSIQGLGDVRRELDNLRAAADWCLVNDQPDLLARLVNRMIGFWWASEYMNEGIQWMREVQRQGERVPLDERVVCMSGLAGCVGTTFDYAAAVDLATQAIEMSDGQASASPAKAMAVRAMNRAFQASAGGADPELAAGARREAAAAYEMARSAPLSQVRLDIELLCAWMETALGDLSAAVRWWGAVIKSCDTLGDEPWTLSVGLAGLAATLHVMGRHDDALRVASRFMALPSQRDTTLAMTSILAVEVAPVLVAGGQHEAANRLLREALRDARRFGVLMADGQALSMIGIAEHLRGRPQRAGRLLAASRQVKGAEMNNGFRSPTGLTFRTCCGAITRNFRCDEATGQGWSG